MSTGRKILLTAVIVGVLASALGAATYAAFFSTTSNSGNSFAAGTVAISDNDASGSLISLPTARPGDSSTGCIEVTYTGSLASAVRLYATTTGTLAQYLTLTITRGTQASPTFPACTGFAADATNYIGAGAGVMYNGALSALPSSFATGLVDPLAASPESWTTSEKHVYRFVVTLDNNNAAQGLSSTATFTWEAQNT